MQTREGRAPALWRGQRCRQPGSAPQTECRVSRLQGHRAPGKGRCRLRALCRGKGSRDATTGGQKVGRVWDERHRSSGTLGTGEELVWESGPLPLLSRAGTQGAGPRGPGREESLAPSQPGPPPGRASPAPDPTGRAARGDQTAGMAPSRGEVRAQGVRASCGTGCTLCTFRGTGDRSRRKKATENRTLRLIWAAFVGG